jgi:chromosome segregation ATPase
MKDPSDELTDRECDAIRFLRNLKGESLSKEQELQAREAIYLLSTNPESSINQILDYARESLDLIPSIRDLFEQHQEEFDKLNKQTEGLQVERQGLANNALRIGEREDLIDENKKRIAEIQIQIASLQNELEQLEKRIPMDEASLIDELGRACSSLQDCDESLRTHKKHCLTKRHEVLNAKLKLEFQCKAFIQFLQGLPKI